MNSSLLFFLGGLDLEMVTIRELLKARGLPFRDKQLGWGASVANYRIEIADGIERGNTPVLIELGLESDFDHGSCVIVDHHGERAGKDEPTSLEQVLELLGLAGEFSSNRHWQLVAANDRGHVHGMTDLSPPASNDEIMAIRRADLAAQGVTDQEFEQAKQDRESTESACNGKLVIVVCEHDRTGLVAETMQPYFGGPGYENILVAGKTEVAFYGIGAVVLRLSQLSDQGWYGGSLPDFGYWGAKRDGLNFDVQAEICHVLAPM